MSPKNLETVSEDSSSPCTSSLLLHSKDEVRSLVSSPGMVKSHCKASNDNGPVALDCEMVGVGDKKSNALGRCSIVDYDGCVLFDTYVKPSQPITDYRTQWSGIRPRNMKNAIAFCSARNRVKRIIKNRVLVGHALQNDLKVLRLKHSSELTRDTSKHIPLRALAGFPRNSTPSLKRLSRQLLKWDIQVNEHDSVEDAMAAMLLYKKCEAEWEKDTKKKSDQSYLEDAYWPSWTKAVNESTEN